MNHCNCTAMQFRFQPSSTGHVGYLNTVLHHWIFPRPPVLLEVVRMDWRELLPSISDDGQELVIYVELPVVWVTCFTLPGMVRCVVRENAGSYTLVWARGNVLPGSHVTGTQGVLNCLSVCLFVCLPACLFACLNTTNDRLPGESPSELPTEGSVLKISTVSPVLSRYNSLCLLSW